MTFRSIIVGAAAAAGLLGALPAGAADLDYGPRAGVSPYDDPRYSDIYRHPAPPPRYAAPYAPPPGYSAPPPYAAAPPAYGAPPAYPYDGRSAACLPQSAIRDRLLAHGWQDFHDPQVMGNVVHIRARRNSGHLFDLAVDRCTGQVLGVETIPHRSAEAPPPPEWRYYPQRPYGY